MAVLSRRSRARSLEIAAAEAATLLNVSIGSVRAKVVQKRGAPNVVAMVERGEVSVPAPLARPSNAEPVKLTGAGECLINLERASAGVA
jgi:hypothetical protein